MSTQIERSAATQAKILSVARVAFVRDGIDGASLDRIAAEAGYTKGALYHHFAGKEALFAAVFALVSGEAIAAAGRNAERSASPRGQLKAAALAWLDAVEGHEARLILLELGPQALGFARMRALEDDIALKPLMALVEAVIDGERSADAVDAMLTAHVINATLTEIALLRHGSDGRVPDREAAERAIGSVIDGLLGGQG